MFRIYLGIAALVGLTAWLTAFEGSRDNGNLDFLSAGGGAGKSDQDFVKAADEVDLAEIKLGKLAQERAASDKVKAFGQRMVDDHTKMNKSLQKVAKALNITLPDELDKKHKELFDQLAKLKGAEFDKLYTKDMIAGHEKAIKKFEAEMNNGQNADVKAWAKEWLPTLREHLELARETVKAVKSAQ